MLATVRAYVENQEEHHRVRSFEEEFLTLLRKSGVRFEERDVLG
jgi:putative transposase